jgi:hypothetical protein
MISILILEDVSTVCSSVLFEKLLPHLPQEITGFLWNPKIHFRVYKSSLPFPVLNEINSSYILRRYYFKINSNIMLPSTFKSPEWSLPFSSFSTKLLYVFLIPAMRAKYIDHFIFLNLAILAILEKCSLQITRLVNMQFSPASCHFLHFWFKYSPKYPFLINLNLCFPPNGL